VRTTIYLAGLRPEDLRVECVIGRIGASGALEETRVLSLPPVQTGGETATFEREIVPAQTGRLGYAVRVCPNHFEDPMTRPVSGLIKWSGR